ncbi:Protein of unknown function [Bacillus mycoides]|nr:Protein of unknown function [Bacillus mycoides]
MTSKSMLEKTGN